jgi:hypothetical protein
MARPKLKIDESQVEQLAAINCSLDEMGAVLNCSADTLGRRFADAIKRGRERGRMSLKRKQYELAMGGNVTMLIWLGKQLLGQTDKREVEANVKSSVNLNAQVVELVEQLEAEGAPKSSGLALAHKFDL